MRRYSDLEVLHIAASEALRRIRDDGRRAPQSLKKLFVVLERDLFLPEMKARYAWEQAGIKDHAQAAVFKQLTKVPLKQYIRERRVEVATLLICTTDLRLTTISMMLGYDYHPTLTEHFKKVKDGELPSDLPRLSVEGPTFDDVLAIRFFRGELDDDEAKGLMRKAHGLYPRAAEGLQKPAPASSGPLIIVEGERKCRLMAGGLWLEIRDLPFEEQKQEVRGYLFCTTALFDLLRKKSRQRGRQNRQHGVELAELALVSLELSDDVFGDRIHDLRALGWAWVGNACVLVPDFSAADTAFQTSDREWSQPRSTRDQTVHALACRLKGILRMFQRNYVEAGTLLDRSCELFQVLGDDHEHAHTLIQRASLQVYAGNLESSIKDLRVAASMLNEQAQPELAFILSGNLANILARSGRYRAASKELDRARGLNSAIHYAVGPPTIAWIDGFISESCGDLPAAQALYESSRSGFSKAGDSSEFALVSVDLMAVNAMQEDWERALELAHEVLPLLETLKLRSETVTAVNLMAQAVKAQTLSYPMLKEVRERLRQDPLRIL